MNLLSLFTREEPIAGLEITDTHLRVALLELKKEKDSSKKGVENLVTKVKFLAEEALPDNVVVNGSLQNTENFVKSLKNLLNKSEIKIRYVIASIPANDIYSRVFSFPKTIQGEKLEETMKLTMGFQLPLKPEDVYLDWQKLETSGQNEILLSAAFKKNINDFVFALDLAGLKTVAIEFHPISFCRALDAKNDETVLIKVRQKSSIGIFIVKNKVPLFVRVLPEQFSTKKLFDKELEKIVDFFESEKGKIGKIIDISETKIIDKFSEHPEIKKDNGKWLVSVGAALRGLTPRAEDNFISLMPIGTEQAYEYQKAIVFFEFVSNAAVGLAIFFIAAFTGVLILIMTIQQKVSKEVENIGSLPLPSDTAELENKARELNNLISATSDIVKILPRWSAILEELKTRIISGILPSSVNLPSPNGIINVSGIAQNRGQMNQFKKIMEDSSVFTEINLPLTNLEQKENIPFNMSFKLKNTIQIYE